MCGNRTLVSELQLLAFLRDELRELHARPGFEEAFVQAFQEVCASKPAEPADTTLVEGIKAQRNRVERLVDAVADSGGSPALTTRLKDEEAKLAASQARRAPPKQSPDVIRAARAFAREAAELLGRDRDTTRAALVALLEPMRLTPRTEGAAEFYEVAARIRIPAIQGDGREVLSKTGCGGRISPLKQTVLLALSSDVSPVRGMSCSEELVRVSEPRLLLDP